MKSDVDKFQEATGIDTTEHDLKKWSMPFDGSGFTQEGTEEPGEINHCAGSPEYRADEPVYIEAGAAIFDIDSNGHEELMGVYDGDLWITTEYGAKWLEERSNG